MAALSHESISHPGCTAGRGSSSHAAVAALLCLCSAASTAQPSCQLKALQACPATATPLPQLLCTPRCSALRRNSSPVPLLDPFLLHFCCSEISLWALRIIHAMPSTPSPSGLEMPTGQVWLPRSLAMHRCTRHCLFDATMAAAFACTALHFVNEAYMCPPCLVQGAALGVAAPCW